MKQSSRESDSSCRSTFSIQWQIRLSISNLYHFANSSPKAYTIPSEPPMQISSLQMSIEQIPPLNPRLRPRSPLSYRKMFSQFLVVEPANIRFSQFQVPSLPVQQQAPLVGQFGSHTQLFISFPVPKSHCQTWFSLRQEQVKILFLQTSIPSPLMFGPVSFLRDLVGVLISQSLMEESHPPVMKVFLSINLMEKTLLVCPSQLLLTVPGSKLQASLKVVRSYLRRLSFQVDTMNELPSTSTSIAKRFQSTFILSYFYVRLFPTSTIPSALHTKNQLSLVGSHLADTAGILDLFELEQQLTQPIFAKLQILTVPSVRAVRI